MSLPGRESLSSIRELARRQTSFPSRVDYTGLPGLKRETERAKPTSDRQPSSPGRGGTNGTARLQPSRRHLAGAAPSAASRQRGTEGTFPPRPPPPGPPGDRDALGSPAAV